MFKFISFNQAASPHTEELLPALKDGDLRAARHYCSKHHGHSHLRSDLMGAFTAVCEAPFAYKNLAETAEFLLEHGVKSEHAFAALRVMHGEQYAERSLWLTEVMNSDEKTAQGYGVLLSEYLRYRLGRDAETYSVSPSELMPPGKIKNPLAGVLRNGGFEAFKNVQHALVAYVAESGPHLPLNRGAALLDQLRGMAGSELWTTNIASISEHNTYSLRAGQRVVSTINYEKT